MASFRDLIQRFTKKGEDKDGDGQSSGGPDKKLVLGGAAVAVLLIAVGGFFAMKGCGDEKTKPVAAQPAPPPSPADGETEAADGEADGGEAADPAAKPDGAAEPAEPVGRPEEVSEWKPADYASAKIEADPKLTAAIERIDAKFQSSDGAASTLVELLRVDPPPPAPNPSEGEPTPPQGRGAKDPKPIAVTAQQAKLIVSALARNSSATARAAMKDLLLGKIETPLDDQQLLMSVLTGMGENLDPTYEQMSFVVLTQPTKIRPPATDPASRSSVTADWLQTETLKAIKASASPELRTRLAEHLQDPQVTLETAKHLETFLSEDRLENRVAQLLLYLNPQTQASIRSKIERHITAQAAEAMARLLRIPPAVDAQPAQPAPQQPTRPTRPSRTDEGATPTAEPAEEVVEFDPAEMDAEFARRLWSAQAVEALAARAAEGQANQSGSALSLLVNVPTVEARQAIAALASAQQEAGPQPWQSAGVLGAEVTDPAILLAIKPLYHEGESNSPTRPTPPRGQVGWRTAAATLVQAWNERLHRAARASRGELAGAPQTPLEDLPVLMHTGANIVARYELTWPNPNDAAAANVAPLKVHYLRVEEEANPEKRRIRYRRYTRKGLDSESPGGVIWLDAVETDSKSGVVRSIDILIHPEQPAGDDRNANVPLVLEVLLLEVPAK